jgi:hypothetical protein
MSIDIIDKFDCLTGENSRQFFYQNKKFNNLIQYVVNSCHFFLVGKCPLERVFIVFWKTSSELLILTSFMNLLKHFLIPYFF